MATRLEVVLATAVSIAVVVLATVVVYALWWNAHFACIQYRPF